MEQRQKIFRLVETADNFVKYAATRQKERAAGFWELRGYHTWADPWLEERNSCQEG